MDRPVAMLSLLTWLPLVAALAVAAAFSRAIHTAALQCPGGPFALPAEGAVVPPFAARVRHVRQPRAPDTPESRRAR